MSVCARATEIVSLPLTQFLAGVYGFTAVGLGAFAAHALKTRLDTYALDIMATATQYGLVHAVLLFVLSQSAANRWESMAAYALALGIPLFSGSLYLLALSGVRWLGAITPVGGLLMIGAWVLIAFSAMKKTA